MVKFEDVQALLSEARIQACVHLGKHHESLEDAISNMPQEFWGFTMFEKDEIEKRLDKHFREIK